MDKRLGHGAEIAQRQHMANPHGVELDGEQAQRALQESLDIEARISTAALRYLREGVQVTDSAYSPFALVAHELGYDGDPTLEPSPFFTTMHGYLTEYTRTLLGQDKERPGHG